ncbi:MAG: hypothetical protein V1851_00540 [Patescibacteria group bacterium]
MLPLILIVFISFIFLVSILLFKGCDFIFWKNFIESKAFAKSNIFFDVFFARTKRLLKIIFRVILKWTKVFLVQLIIIVIKIKNKIYFWFGKIKKNIEDLNIKETKGSVSVYMKDLESFKKEKADE